MTDYAKLARQLYEDGSTPFDQVQTAALIAIAEALQPRPEPKPEPPATINIEGDYDPASLRDGVQAVLDHDPRHQAQRELDELREVVKGADHTAAKYYKRMRDAERDRDHAAKRHRAAALRDVADDVIRGTRHNWVATEIAAALRGRADQEEGVTDADPRK